MFTKRFYRFNGTFGTIELVTLVHFSFLIVHVFTKLTVLQWHPPLGGGHAPLYNMINYDYNNYNIIK